jgi:1-acyl-sn-glycerol-3-phosphate acyltransferase
MYIWRQKHRAIRKIWAKFQIFCIRANIEIIGDRLDNTRIFILNHQSMLDITILEAYDCKNPSWIAKKEIADIPFFGKIISLPKMIAVDRDSKKSLIKLLKDVRDRLKESRDIFIFPEGTRSKSGQMLPFKDGAKIIADKFDLNVQPIVIVNSKRALNEFDKSSKKSNIKIIYLDTIDRSSDNWLENTRKDMQKVYDDELANSISNR